MPSVQVPAFTQLLASDGGKGYVTVTSNANFYPGCEAWLTNDTRNQRCIITDLVSTNQVGIRFIAEEKQGYKLPNPQYGRSDCTAFTTATNSALCMPAQLAPVNPAFTKILSVIND